jgi:hypothetical protein
MSEIDGAARSLLPPAGSTARPTRSSPNAPLLERWRCGAVPASRATSDGDFPQALGDTASEE